MTAKKWLDSIAKQKERSSLKECDRRTDVRTEEQTDGVNWTIIDSQARRGDQ